MLNADNKRLLNNNGSLNDKNIKDKISSILEQDKFSIPSDGAYQLVLPIAALILFGIIFLINSLFIKNQKFSFYILLLIIGIIMLLCVIVIPLIFYSNKLIKENQNKIESLEDCFRNECNDAFKQSKLNEIDSINTYCFDCLKIQEGNVLNAYNLFSYEQILKIEERVGNSEGKNRAVFSYSTYRDDGEDVGIAEAEAIVQANKRKGVKYYEIFYSDQEGADIDGDEIKDKITIKYDIDIDTSTFNNFDIKLLFFLKYGLTKKVKLIMTPIIYLDIPVLNVAAGGREITLSGNLELVQKSPIHSTTITSQMYYKKQPF